MASLKDLQDQLLAAVAPGLAARGFPRWASGQSFSRITPFGRQTFHLGFIKHASDVDVTADVAIRIDALEDLLNEWNGTLSTAERKRTHSLGAELGNIAEGRQHRWALASDQDVPTTAASVIARFEAVGLPYIQRYSDLDHALEALSGDDRAAWLHAPVHDVRASRAVGLAFVLGQLDRLDGLVAAKTRFLHERSDPGLPRFQAFANEILRRRDEVSSAARRR
jgi:hypothetical protein